MKKKICQVIAFIALLSLFCSKSDKDEFLGSGMIELPTYEIGSMVTGTVLAMFADEGEKVRKDQVLAIMDTMEIQLSRKEIQCMISELSATVLAKRKEVFAKNQEMELLLREKERNENLFKAGAVPFGQMDEIRTRAVSRQNGLNAERHVLQSLLFRVSSLQVKLEQAEEQYHRCFLRSPCDGRILSLFRRKGEIAFAGSPLFTIGNQKTVKVGFYVSQPMLLSVKAGDTIWVSVDMHADNTRRAIRMPGTIAYIGEEAEFYPKNIQSKESRNEQVFHVEAIILNHREILKRGLFVEVWKSKIPFKEMQSASLFMP